MGGERFGEKAGATQVRTSSGREEKREASEAGREENLSCEVNNEKGRKLARRTTCCKLEKSRKRVRDPSTPGQFQFLFFFFFLFSLFYWRCWKAILIFTTTFPVTNVCTV